MNTTSTIEEFDKLLKSDKDMNPLLEALHKLLSIEPEEIRTQADVEGWGEGWSAL